MSPIFLVERVTLPYGDLGTLFGIQRGFREVILCNFTVLIAKEPLIFKEFITSMFHFWWLSKIMASNLASSPKIKAYRLVRSFIISSCS